MFSATHFQSALHLYFALIENRSFLTSKNSGSQFNRSISVQNHFVKDALGRSDGVEQAGQDGILPYNGRTLAES
jgi:hypothetical protein